MSRIITSLLQASTRSTAFWYGILALVIPVLVLLLFGVLHLYQSGWLLYALLIWLVVSLFAFLVFMAMPGITLLRQPVKPDTPESTSDMMQGQALSDWSSNDIPHQLAENTDWTEQDRQIWYASLSLIEELLADKPAWSDLPDRSLNLMATLSTWYDTSEISTADSNRIKRAEYRFTIPDVLLVISVASERYRKLVINHFPFIDQVTVRTLLSLYERRDNIRQGWTWANRTRRVLRLANPVAAVLGEAREQITSSLFSHFSDSAQKDLKSLLLQEVVQVGMDLYSGRLKHSSEEIGRYRSQILQADQDRLAPRVEPLRLVLLGQPNAGKSSLINALLGELGAEMDSLASTPGLQTHIQTSNDDTVRHLIDTPGIEDTHSVIESLTHAASTCDLIVWLCRANQPARHPDRMLYDSIKRWFSDRPERRPPPLVLVMTHIDLLPPRGEWAPPYDLKKPDRKAQAIRASLIRTIEDIGLPPDTPAVPACLLTGKLYNLQAIEDQLHGATEEAFLTQFNRRRQELSEQGSSWAERWQQAKRLGYVMGGVASRASPIRQGRKSD